MVRGAEVTAPPVARRLHLAVGEKALAAQALERAFGLLRRPAWTRAFCHNPSPVSFAWRIRIGITIHVDEW